MRGAFGERFSLAARVNAVLTFSLLIIVIAIFKPIYMFIPWSFEPGLRNIWLPIIFTCGLFLLLANFVRSQTPRPPLPTSTLAERQHLMVLDLKRLETPLEEPSSCSPRKYSRDRDEAGKRSCPSRPDWVQLLRVAILVCIDVMASPSHTRLGSCHYWVLDTVVS